MSYFTDPTRPVTGVFTPTKSDTVDFDVPARQILWLADGDINCVFLDGTTHVFTGAEGDVLPFPSMIKRINSTSTTLSNSDMLCGK